VDLQSSAFRIDINRYTAERCCQISAWKTDFLPWFLPHLSDKKKLNQEDEIHWEELPTLIFRPTISQKKLYKVAMTSFCCPKKCTVSLLQMCSTDMSHS
jgi:hypothetical protein